MSSLADDYFRKKNPKEIIDDVAILTLANISKESADELERIGWLHNSIIDILYSLTSAGVWASRVDTGGYSLDALIQFGGQKVIANLLTSPFVGDIPADFTSTSTAVRYQRHIGMLALGLDGAGAKGDTPIHTGPAGYYPVVKILGIWSPSADASTTFGFTVTGGALVGPSSIVLALVANSITPIASNGIPLYLYDLTDASVININVTGGPVGVTLYLIYEYWSET